MRITSSILRYAINTKYIFVTGGVTSSLGKGIIAAKNYTEVTEMEPALKIYKMLEEFAADEDGETVWNTADISDTLWKEVEQFVASKKFRT